MAVYKGYIYIYIYVRKINKLSPKICIIPIQTVFYFRTLPDEPPIGAKPCYRSLILRAKTAELGKNHL